MRATIFPVARILRVTPNIDHRCQACGSCPHGATMSQKIGPVRGPLVTLRNMERRTKRSEDREEALQYLVEALADRSEVDAVLLMNDEGHIVAGMGKPKEIKGLAKIAVPVVKGETCGDFDTETAGTDFFG